MSTKRQPHIATRKEKIGSVILFVWYFLIMIIIPEIITSFWDISDTFALVFTIFTYVSLVFGSLLVFGRRLRRDFCALRDDFRTYARWFFPRAGVIYIIYIVVAFAAALLSGKRSENQISLTSMSLWFMAPMACLYAPLVEECVFRGALRRIIKKDWLFIAISGLTFGFIHVIGEPTLADTIILSLPYITIGCGAAYLYTQSNNIFTNISYHFLHNSISILFLILLA